MSRAGVIDRAATERRNERIFHEHIAGESFRQIGPRHGISAMHAHTVFWQEADKHLDELERRLVANHGTDELEVLLIPGHSGAAFDEAIGYVRWLVEKLGERGIELRCSFRVTFNGVAVGFQAVTNGEH